MRTEHSAKRALHQDETLRFIFVCVPRYRRTLPLSTQTDQHKTGFARLYSTLQNSHAPACIAILFSVNETQTLFARQRQVPQHSHSCS